MQTASNNYRAYALDMWGFGDTAKIAGFFNLQQQVSLVNAFLEKMGILKIAIVGHGLGAVVALQCAMQQPELVDRLLVISYPLTKGKINNRLLFDSPELLADWLLDRGDQTEPVRSDAPKTDPEVVSTSINDLNSDSLQQNIFTNESACLLVHGENDPAVQPPGEDRILALPEQAHYIGFERTGHFPMLDESSKFNRLLLDYLALDSGESPRRLQLKEQWKRRVR